MDLATFTELLTATGRAALAAAGELRPTEATFLPCYERLRRAFPAALAKAALETVLLRARAADKFPTADRLFFTREALEQASGLRVARHRARRFAPFDSVADLCSGIGGDTLALAEVVPVVEAVELDPLRAAMAKANVAETGVSDRVRVHCADAACLPLPAVRAAFADPSRRLAGVRRLDPDDYAPPLATIRQRFPAGFPLGVKVAPGIRPSGVAGPDCEAEFVSLDGEMKECVLWYGPLRTTGRRATLLPSGHTLADDKPRPLPTGAGSTAWVFDPDPAVVRAGLAGTLAERLGLRALDPAIALLSAADVVWSPFLVAYRVDYAERWHYRRLNDFLRQRGVGRVTVIKRGGRIEPAELEKRLRLRGEEHRFVLLTRRAGEAFVIVAQRVQVGRVEVGPTGPHRP